MVSSGLGDEFVTSLAFDSLSDLYSPIIMLNKGIGYSDSFLANLFSIKKFMAAEMIIFAQICFAYFSCVYCRRGESEVNFQFISRLFWLPIDHFYGSRRVALFIFLQIYGLIFLLMSFHYYTKAFEASEPVMPLELGWLNNRTSFFYLQSDSDAVIAHLASDSGAAIIAIIMIIMLVQLVIEVQSGMTGSSSTTKRYQQLAVRSLILQGVVPGFFYVIPNYANIALQFSPSISEFGERIATHLSPILWIVITKHTFVSSLTILYTMPAYRRRIFELISRTNSSVTPILDEMKGSDASDMTRI